MRILCFHSKFERAAGVVRQISDLGAAFHLAKQYEGKEMVKEAIHYFQQARRFNHAVRLAIAHDLASELNMVALSAPLRTVLEAAVRH